MNVPRSLSSGEVLEPSNARNSSINQIRGNRLQALTFRQLLDYTVADRGLWFRFFRRRAGVRWHEKGVRRVAGGRRIPGMVKWEGRSRSIATKTNDPTIRRRDWPRTTRRHLRVRGTHMIPTSTRS
jgi:hypothetical protein